MCVHKLGCYFRVCIYLKPYKHIALSANSPPPPLCKKVKKFIGLHASIQLNKPDMYTFCLVP